MLEVRLLGGVGLCLEGRPVDRLKPGRALELLALLLLERETAQPRAHLAARLWPDTDEAQARTNLRRELHTLRHALPDHESYLGIGSRALAWAPSRPWRSDLSEFEAAMASDDHERAIKEYGGELLPGCYEEWLQPYRERLHSSYCQALERCAERREERGDWPAAVAAWRALLALEPLREELYRHMMSLHLRAGERAQAVAVWANVLLTWSKPRP